MGENSSPAESHRKSTTLEIRNHVQYDPEYAALGEEKYSGEENQ